MVKWSPSESPAAKTLGACGPSGFGLGTSLGTPFAMIPPGLSTDCPSTLQQPHYSIDSTLQQPHCSIVSTLQQPHNSINILYASLASILRFNSTNIRCPSPV